MRFKKYTKTTIPEKYQELEYVRYSSFYGLVPVIAPDIQPLNLFSKFGGRELGIYLQYWQNELVILEENTVWVIDKFNDQLNMSDHKMIWEWKQREMDDDIDIETILLSLHFLGDDRSAF